MRETNAPPPVMTQSPVYSQHHSSPMSFSPVSSSQPHVQRPIPAHLTYQSEKFPRGSDHVKASISSATSGSTDATDSRFQHISQAHHQTPDLERGQEHSTSRSHCNRGQSSRISENRQRSREMIQAHPDTVIRYIRQDVDEDDEDVEEPDHAIWILFWMSLIDPFYSLFSCIFSIFTLLILVVISPIRLCQRDWSFSTCLIRTICPVYRKHLHLLYADSVDNAHNFEFSPARLILVHLTAPAISVCMAFFSWIAAVFWLFAITMGNPDGTEKKDDGRTTVLMARSRWEKFLLLALRRR